MSLSNQRRWSAASPLLADLYQFTMLQAYFDRQNLVHFATTIASKAGRCVLAAPGKTLVDFGMRRAHGSEAGLLAACAAYLAGFTGTATMLANAAFGVTIV